MRLGLTLRSNLHPRHIFVVLSDPSQTAGQILLVNFTSWQSPRDDNEEIFSSTDYPLLRHRSVIAFWGAHAGEGARLEAAIREGSFTILPDLPAQTLRRILMAARGSRHLSPIQKRLLPETSL